MAKHPTQAHIDSVTRRIDTGAFERADNRDLAFVDANGGRRLLLHPIG